MNAKEVSNELLTFIQNSPSMFHSIQSIRTYLDEAGFTYVPEELLYNSQPFKYHRIQDW